MNSKTMNSKTTTNSKTINSNRYRRATAPRRISLTLSVLAVLGMGTATVACTPRNERPAETGVTSPANVNPTEKGIRTNVTRSPMAAVPPGVGGGNPAVPCGFGPAGGGPCSNNN